LYDLSLKDPMVGRSDDWEFPTNRLPNIGWLGRIHRGTPVANGLSKSAGGRGSMSGRNGAEWRHHHQLGSAGLSNQF